MSSILQEGVAPDWQNEVRRPLAGKHHTDRPADVQNLITGQRWVHRAGRDVKGGEGHGHVPECAAISQEVQ